MKSYKFIIVIAFALLLLAACQQPGGNVVPTFVPPTPVPTQPPPVSQSQLASLEVGVDAEGNFYRGDPNAPIRLVDFSDFQ